MIMAILLIHVFGMKSKSYPGVLCDVSHLCVHINRCGAYMTDNLSRKYFYSSHLSVVMRSLLSQQVLLSATDNSAIYIICTSINAVLNVHYIQLFNLGF